MKKFNFLTVTLGLIVLGLVVSCDDDDNGDAIAPIITLNGDETMCIALFGTFVDPGATAADDVDGDLTSSIQTTDNINPDAVGTYQVTYSVSDGNGNVGSATRTVEVAIKQENYLGQFTVADDCPILYPVNATQNIGAGPSDSIIVFTDFFIGTSVEAAINGQEVVITNASLPLGTTLSGTGSLNDNTQFLIFEAIFTNGLGATDTCTLTYSK